MTQTSSPSNVAADPFAAPQASPASPAEAEPGTTAESFGGADPFGAAASAEPAGLSGQDWAIAVGAVLAAAILFWFVRRAVEGALAKNHAAPDAAGGAAWALFGFLVIATATVVFGVVGDLWSVDMFLWPALGLTLIMLILTAVMFRSALGRRR